MTDYSFPKKAHLKSRTTINDLFAKGNKKLIHPVLYQYAVVENPRGVQTQVLFGVTVSKKKAKKAVQRNRIKRQLREAYRLRPFVSLELNDQQQIAIMAVYIGDVPADYNLITRSMHEFKTWIEKKYS